MKLSQILAERKAKNEINIPAEKWAVMQRSTNEVKKRQLASKALQTGDELPSFILPDIHGNTITLEGYEDDFLIVSFYRGGWCPFCNMELKALQNILPELNKLNTLLVAISPETPDNSITTSEKNGLSFSVLSDINNRYAKSLGLVFELPEDLRTVYHSFNINVEKHNGNQDYELPMPATYVVNKNRQIIYSFTPEDYTVRLEPELILEIIKNKPNKA
ncbi:peroxiredoxin-like family protein [Seonamhaeicola marinus]|uniref:thioredoxin-dependent peroxiredoxin n=1 Tax=Seonamhaeicola marinus TaxID=1912246 RepID=A0A5D0IZ59_9FLAO|nr:peroxiredoxin-like family protein [Seonamhaeicola marinus]TYA89215.1 AhpC/TSA family protein [Seonamhaeicola marinus]